MLFTSNSPNRQTPKPQEPPWKRSLRRFMNHPATDVFVIVLILVSISLLIAEILFPNQRYIFESINLGLTILFSIELVLRYLAERKTSRFIRRYWIDVIAVLAPYFRSLRILRILRLLRIFRLGKLLNRRFSGIQSWLAFSLAQHFWLIFLVITLVIAGAVTFHLAEPNNPQVKTFQDAVWWSMFTLVGGEPLTGAPAQTFSGRLISLIIIIAGVVTFASIAGIIAAIMINRLKPQMERGDMDLEELENHIVICGWSRSANLLLAALQNSEEYWDKGIVLVAEFGEGQPEDLLDKTKIVPSTLYVVKGDFTRLEVLERAGIQRASEAIVLADQIRDRSDQDRDARSVLAAMLIEKQNPEIFTCVELLNRDNAAHLSMMGVEEILVTDEYAGTILANAQRTRGIITMLNELFDPTRGNQFYKVPLPDAWSGKTIGNIFDTLKRDHEAILVSIETTDEHGTPQLKVNPPNHMTTKTGDKLVVIAQRRLDLKNV
ncbi:MAG: ion transporter [Myxococcales bacterium]|nr:ion transporter [Myxococcales bacterium]MCB9644230.1 ion transporter [Myxococcales bacterium]